MTDAADKPVVIAGAGLAGSLMACFLGRRGMPVEVYERRPDPRSAGFIGGRSINLALSVRGLHALGQVGLADQVLDEAIPMPGRMMHARDGDLTFQPYGRSPGEAINSVSRGRLNVLLLEAADAYDNISMHFGVRCTDVDLDGPSATFLHEESGRSQCIETNALLGCDGAFSAVRGAMQKTERFSYSQTYIDHGYKELHIPATDAGDFAMEPGALHIWPRRQSMMIALPNHDRSFTCTLFWPFSGPDGFDSIRDDDELMTRFRHDYADAIPLMPTLIDDYNTNPTSSLVTIRCDPWHVAPATVVLGDAAHAVVPFYGQGMNAAFEDCAILDELIDRHEGDWPRILAALSAERPDDANAIADMALDNFIEMRDHVASPAFVRRQKFEKRLHAWIPGYVPLYNMVSFTRIPYAEARERSRRQQKTVRQVMTTGVVFTILTAALLAWLMLR